MAVEVISDELSAAAGIAARVYRRTQLARSLASAATYRM
jgi:hypothetical protein